MTDKLEELEAQKEMVIRPIKIETNFYNNDGDEGSNDLTICGHSKITYNM